MGRRVDPPRSRRRDAGSRLNTRVHAVSRATSLQEARSRLHDADPVMARLIDARPDFDPHAWIAQLPPMDLYGALLFQIVGQQLSVAATRRTLERIQALLPVIFPRQPSCSRRTRAACGKLGFPGGRLAHSATSLRGCRTAGWTWMY